MLQQGFWSSLNIYYTVWIKNKENMRLIRIILMVLIVHSYRKIVCRCMYKVVSENHDQPRETGCNQFRDF